MLPLAVSRSFSNSTLCAPQSPIHKLAQRVGELIYFPNPDALYCVLGVVAGNCLKGTPVWLVLVGPPADGKTLLLDMLDSIPKVHTVDVIDSPASLLSGTPSKDVSKGSTGGLLRTIGKRGLISVKDFTVMMSLPNEPLVKVLGALRRVYDGSWERPIGTDGGKVLTWYGRVGFLSACTSAVDRHHQLLAELGERWMYYRFGESDGYGATRKALSTENPQSVMAEMEGLVREFFDEVGLAWLEDGMERRKLDERESNRLFAMAAMVSASRSPVSRDVRTREVVDIKETETPTRLAAALGQLLLGLECIGLEEEDRWRVVGKVALDSMPGIRLKLLRMLFKGPGVNSKDMRERLGCGANTVRLVAEDLMLHGVVEKVEKGDGRMGERAGSYRLTSWSKKQIAIGFGAKS